jgi:hypothetical protein
MFAIVCWANLHFAKQVCTCQRTGSCIFYHNPCLPSCAGPICFLPSKWGRASKRAPVLFLIPYTLWLKVMCRGQHYRRWRRPHLSKNAWCALEHSNNMENLFNLNWIACNNSVQVIDVLWFIISFWSTFIRASCHFQ